MVGLARGAHCAPAMNAIKKFNSEVQQLHQTQRARDNVRRTLRTAQSTLKTDTRTQKRDTDLFTQPILGRRPYFLPKPFSLAGLLDKVREALAGEEGPGPAEDSG